MKYSLIKLRMMHRLSDYAFRSTVQLFVIGLVSSEFYETVSRWRISRANKLIRYIVAQAKTAPSRQLP